MAPSIWANASVKVAHQASLERQACLDSGGTAGNRRLAVHLVADVSLGEEAIGADGIERHQDKDEAGGRHPQCRRSAMAPQPGDGGQLAELERHTHADDWVERAGEDRGHASDGEVAGHTGKRQGRRQSGEPDTAVTRRGRLRNGGGRRYGIDRMRDGVNPRGCNVWRDWGCNATHGTWRRRLLPGGRFVTVRLGLATKFRP